MQPRVQRWFESRAWTAFPFQREVWEHYRAGRSGLIHSATGTGKTLAAWLGPIQESLDEEDSGVPALRVLWITPLRALAADTLASLRDPVAALGLAWSVEARTGDTSSSVRQRQNEKLPTALVTTPESLTLMLAREDSRKLLAGLRCVIVDEWHELMSTKRGVQTELALARLRQFTPGLRTWGVSATMGNLDEAMQTLVGTGGQGTLVRGEFDKELIIDSILPPTVERFPWAGHFGTQMVPHVIEAIEEGETCLIFTNTRAQAEIWYQMIRTARPDWDERIGLHHGSLDRDVRDGVEAGLKSGQLRAVVCTSSLDLGVDFSPVDRVLQVGSPKGVARLLQRAGRSGHRPGAPSRVTCVPTHAMEMIDIPAARDAAFAGRVEAREGLRRPLDVLAQHLVTIALGGGFRRDEMLAEVRTAYAYRDLSDAEFDWALNFVTTGGSSLRAYSEYRKVTQEGDLYVVKDAEVARRHRMSMGTIVSDAAMAVQYMSGARLGTVEESFIARLKPGDKFTFSGKALQFIRVQNMTAYVKRAPRPDGLVPRWGGGRLPLSNELARAIRQKLEEAKYGELASEEMQRIAPILETQAQWSALPAEDEFLIESVETREGHHLFFFPFEGRLVHEGLAALFAYRMAQVRPITFTMACNDYGFELLSAEPAPMDEALASGLLASENLGEHIMASLNSVEMARRQFREIARIAGLVFQGYPGAGKSAKQVQASSGLFFDVFERYEPENMLLEQARREVLERQLEESRMQTAVTRLRNSRLLRTHPPRPTPMAFPILVDRLRETLTTEQIADRLERMSLVVDDGR